MYSFICYLFFLCVHVCGAHSSHDTCVGQDSFQELILSSTMCSSGPLDLAANTFSLAGGWSWTLNFWFHCFCFPRATTTGMCHCARLSSHTLMLCYEVCIYFIYTYVSGCYSLFIFNLLCFEMLCNPNWPQIYSPPASTTIMLRLQFELHCLVGLLCIIY